MDRHTLEVLGFPRVREILAGFCSTDMGRERALALQPVADAQLIAAELDRLDEVVGLAEEPPLGDVKDVRPLLLQLRASGLLTGEELLRVRLACTGIRKCREFFRNERQDVVRVWSLIHDLVPQPELEREIDDAIDEAGAVRDSATPELAGIRRRFRSMRNALVKRLERMAADNPVWFGGAATVKGGRFVLPLLLEHRAGVPGVIHGSSGSGSTLFVEPLATVSDGNELQELQDAEAEEVARILRALSRLVAEHVPELSMAMDAAGMLDLLVAKRRFAARFDCRRPEPAENGRLELAKARHPLLLHRKVSVVPLDIRFPDTALVVLISGPNAGGKTVVLKTLGLLALMFNAGMYVPAGSGTRLPVFKQVFADIGDEQSLDSDLSSFTAHVGRLKEILDRADAESLVLIDEIGSSTAPEEGAALAVAVLEALRDRGVKSVVTTHFGALKMFAQDEPGMANAAMEWGMGEGEKGTGEMAKGRGGPTYRLKMGFPGESSAFEIAAGAGMPAKVIERARTRIGREWLDMGAKLRSLDEELHKAQVARSAAELEQQRAARLRQDCDGRLREAREEARTAKERLRAEEERFLREKRREIENLVRQIKEQKASHESVVAAKQHVEQALAEVEPEPEEPELPGSAPEELKPGDSVESHTFRRQGVVVETSENRATVAFGQIRVELAVADLRLVKPADLKPEPEPVSAEPYNFDTRLNVRGMTREEADEAVTKFLDEARMTGSVELTIVHGKGGGVLRRAIWDRLRRDSGVETVSLAEAAAGGSGVTVVKLKSCA
ncbi:MAG: endonuclease MutS2 [candidate division WOR-3 bacterium]|nr:endonuclease MutS2 [candidate division WOR-3 bacterium]